MPDTPFLKSAEQSRYEQYKNKYERESVPILSGLNLDASDGNLGKNEFTVVKNLRMHTPAELEIRSGYGQYDDSVTGTAPKVLCKAEYRNGQNIFFDVTVYERNSFGSSIQITAVARTPVPGSTAFASANVASTLAFVDASGSPTVGVAAVSGAQICAAVQYLSYLVVTIYGVGTYAIYPTSSTCDTWRAELLGKAVCPSPWRTQFQQTHLDDLIVFQWDTTNPAGAYKATENTDLHRAPDAPLYLYSRVPCKATYEIASTHNYDAMQKKMWLWNDNNPDGTKFNQPRSEGHLSTNAWGYRAVAVIKKTDPRGNPVTTRTVASVDWWVPDNIYCPPQIYHTNGVGNPNTYPGYIDSDVHIMPLTGGPLTGGGARLKFIYYSNIGAGSTYDDVIHTHELLSLPTPTGVKALVDAMNKLEGKTWTVDTTNNTGIYYDQATAGWQTPWIDKTAWWIGHRFHQGRRIRVFYDSTGVGNPSSGISPYWTEVPASFLAEAPLATFTWKDFSTTDGTTTSADFLALGNVVEIEIYRTAFNESTAVLTDNTPLFQPHQYGYVGSVTLSSDFTDTIKDSAINFGKRPEDYDGYLAGQFSGQVIRAYNRKLVVGNVSQDYIVLPPNGELMQSFIYADFIPGAYKWDDVTDNIAADGDHVKQFYISYIDGDSNESDLSAVNTIKPPISNGASTYIPGELYPVAFLLPLGYAPIVTKTRIYKSNYAAGVRTYTLIAEVDVSKGYYVSDNSEPPISSTTTRPTHSVKNTKEQGAVLWSEVYSIWDWPPINFELISADSPITALEAIMGPLWVWTDKSVDLSTISIVFPRGEEETKWIGAIGRFAICKVNKIVFFLSAQGIMFMESSGPVPFPANIQTEIYKYLSEYIVGVAPLTNAKRASMGYLPHRGELWLYLPSSVDLGGTLPSRLFIYKFFDDNIAKFVNYEFDLTAAGNPDGQILFQTQTDGQMFCSYPLVAGIRTLDTDTQAVWLGTTEVEKSWAMGDINLLKIMRAFDVTIDLNANLTFYTGAKNSTGTYDATKGYINTAVNGYPSILPVPSVGIKAIHELNDIPIETTSYAPITRMVTSPLSGNHNIRYKGMTLWYNERHRNPTS